MSYRFLPLLLTIFALTACAPKYSAQSEPLVKLLPQKVHFSVFNDEFRFSGLIPGEWLIEYIPEIESLNLYDPGAAAEEVRNKSQIFVRFFKAKSFLTLGTVTIHNREETAIKEHSAVRYEIEKKAELADFPHQPDWRNARHKLIDIRLTDRNPSAFFVIAENPSLDPALFQAFIDSLIFDNDLETLHEPLLDSSELPALSAFAAKCAQNWCHELNLKPVTAASPPIQFFAICTGPLANKPMNGNVTQYCLFKNRPVIVAYQNIDVSTVSKKYKDYLRAGEPIGYTAKDKNLHLWLHQVITQNWEDKR